MKPGTRVRLNGHCIWPERVGCEGIVVDPPNPGTYPAAHGPSEVIVLLDDDPLGRNRAQGWTCVTSKRSLDAATGGPEGEGTP